MGKARTMPRELRVLAVLPQLSPGGIQVMWLQLLPQLRAEGLDVETCVVGRKGPLDDRFRALGYPVMRMRKWASCRIVARSFERLLARGRYDVVHSHMSYISGGVALASARRRVPICVSLHNGGPTSLYRWRDRAVLQWIRGRWLAWHRGLEARCVDLWMGHSAANLDAFAHDWQLRPQRFRLVRNAVAFPPRGLDRETCRRALRFSPQRCVLLHVGRFAPQKNHTGLLEIFRLALRRRPDLELVLVGDGPGRAGIEYMARRMGIVERVRFEGAKPR
jgi:glycosyltransferase involved in cell wall biosynthesis